MGARWRSADRAKSEHPTADLFHCSDKHGITGVLPNFSAGESWETIHRAAHDAGRVTKEHTH